MLRVLVVEKDPVVARLYREELSDAGFAVQVLPDLGVAMCRLESEPAQMLVTDLESAGERLESWLPRIRRLHGGPLIVLGPPQRRLPRDDGQVRLLPKSSDVRPLIASLHGEAVRMAWSRPGTPSC